jgi:hypothetical protein
MCCRPSNLRHLPRQVQNSASVSPLFAFSFSEVQLAFVHCAKAVSTRSQAVEGSDMTRATHPSLIPEGVAVPDPPRPPRSASCASLSFCSSASARRLRKSESATRPTVWVLSKSSAVLLWEVKRGLGVDAPEAGLDDIGNRNL